MCDMSTRDWFIVILRLLQVLSCRRSPLLNIGGEMTPNANVVRFLMPLSKEKQLAMSMISFFTPSPPRQLFWNNASCQPFAGFIRHTLLLDRLHTGAVSLRGQVGELDPPYIVVPLNVEPNNHACIMMPGT